MKPPVVGKRPPFPVGKIQPVLLFLTGMGFLALGLRAYPAFIVVGGLFVVIGYRGFTCPRRAATALARPRKESKRP